MFRKLVSTFCVAALVGAAGLATCSFVGCDKGDKKLDSGAAEMTDAERKEAESKPAGAPEDGDGGGIKQKTDVD